MINPIWLKTFIKLAKLGNFTRTAEELGLTQAAVSQHIRQLEKNCGPLLVRRGRVSELTPQGEALLQYAEEVEEAERRLTGRLDAQDAENGEVRLMTPGSIGLFLHPALLELQIQNPGLHISHRFGPDREVLAEVLNRHVDFGIVSTKPNDDRISAHFFCTEPLELIVPAGKKPETWDELIKLGFIDHPDGLAMARRLLNRRFPDNPGVETLPKKRFTNQIGQLLDPVACGLGFTVIPRYARIAFPQQDKIQLMKCGQEVKDTLWRIQRAEWPLPRRAERVIQWLADRPSDVQISAVG